MMTASSRVIPAVLTDDPGALSDMLRLAGSFTDYVQIDIMDGEFVPSRSVTAVHLKNLGIPVLWEAHIMVRSPQDYLADFKLAGAKKVIFHYEADRRPLEVIARARELSLEVGLAVNPETALEAFLPLAEKVDSILFMAVNPGFYGAPFIPEVMTKIAAFRGLRPDFATGIDGGVKEDNVGMIARSGVNNIYVGSAIFRQADPAAAFRRLNALAQGG
ncbi:MAG: ribulose-phosphate 3-epimerase [Chloroflexota bacterium]